MLIVAFFQTGRVGQFKVGKVVRHKGFQTCLRVFVEPLEQGYGEGVAELEMVGAVVDGVAGQLGNGVVVLGVVVVGGVVGLVDALVVVELQRVDKTGHGHILVFRPRGVGSGGRLVGHGIALVTLQLGLVFFLVPFQTFLLGLAAGLFLGAQGFVLLLRLHGEFLGLYLFLRHRYLTGEA